MKAERGCTADLAYDAYEVDKEKLRRCPRSFLTEDAADALRLYGHYEAGFLPTAGGIMDQTPAFIRAMEIIGAAAREKE